ncbi:MAG: hypothetical protein ACOX9R_16530 [Armatimonadota bacterium]|jgi:hypothetical protein
MPEAAEILDQLQTAADQGWPLAVAWHAVMLAAVVALVVGWRPDRRLAGALLAAPSASVSAVAWLIGNPFNGAVFAVLSAALVILALRLAPRPVSSGAMWATAAGAVMIGFGWVYPHFVSVESTLALLFRSPFGLIPCPTLSVVIGFALLADGLGSRAWSLLLAGTGLLYALIGTLRLGVQIDLFLLAGAVALIGVAVTRRSAQ